MVEPGVRVSLKELSQLRRDGIYAVEVRTADISGATLCLSAWDPKHGIWVRQVVTVVAAARSTDDPDHCMATIAPEEQVMSICYKCGGEPYQFPVALASRVTRPICGPCILSLLEQALMEEPAETEFWLMTKSASAEIERRRLRPLG